MRVFSGKKSNMEFMLNGPRLQASLVEGIENFGSIFNGYADGNSPSYAYYSGNNDSVQYNDPAFNNIRLFDLADGRQAVMACIQSTWNSQVFFAPCRYALKTTTPDTYLICTPYRADNYSWIAFERTKVGQGPWPEYGNIQTLNVELDSVEWRLPRGGGASTFALTNTNTFVTSYSTPYHKYYTPTDWSGWVTNTDSKVGLAISGSTITLTVVFPASQRVVLHNYPNTGLSLFPMHLNGRRFATYEDSIMQRSASSGATSYVYKVYSPYKNCICLKSYLNGEIPILNE